MCLIRDDSIKITGDRVWKVLMIRSLPTVRNFSSKKTVESIIRDYHWKKGWNEAYIPQPESSKIIRYGFHVYLKKEDAERYYKKYLGHPYFKFAAVEFTFDLKDLIATGRHEDHGTEEAVFKRLHLTEEEYKRVLST